MAEVREPKHIRTVDDLESLIGLASEALEQGLEAEAARLMGRIFSEAALEDVKNLIGLMAEEWLGALGTDAPAPAREKAKAGLAAAADSAAAERNDEALRHAQDALAALPEGRSRHPGARLIALGLQGALARTQGRPLGGAEPAAADWVAMANEGTRHYAAGRYEESLACYERAAAANADNASLWYNKGNALRMLKRPLEEVFSCYQEAVRLDPRHAGAWTNGALMLEMLSRWGDADAFWNESLKLDANRAEAWARKALCLHRLGRDAEAAPACERAVQLKPGLAQAWAIKAAVESRLGNTDKAREAYARANELQKPTGSS